jgi:hypothetical protein
MARAYESELELEGELGRRNFVAARGIGRILAPVNASNSCSEPLRATGKIKAMTE